ncbi:MAG: SDR family oxidoreductase [Chloroflexi bacterium]|nr:SDR family oxidoreductase [Chloroflexota bacterium]
MPIPRDWTLAGKVALLTSNGQGWSPVLAAALAEAGADVAVASRSQRDLEDVVQAVRQQHRRALSLHADVSRARQVRALVETTVAELGRIDILVNNAQVAFGKPFAEVSLKEMQRIMELNVTSVFLCCQEVGKQMLKQGSGRIVNITSGLALRGLANSAVYCASMGAVHQLTQALALEWARNNIRVNGIGPGWLTLEEVPLEEQQKDPLVRFLPSRRLGRPQDIAVLLVYLASDLCDYVAGQTIFVDGGALAHP